jgi:hypothetical protein
MLGYPNGQMVHARPSCVPYLLHIWVDLDITDASVPSARTHTGPHVTLTSLFLFLFFIFFSSLSPTETSSHRPSPESAARGGCYRMRPPELLLPLLLTAGAPPYPAVARPARWPPQLLLSQLRQPQLPSRCRPAHRQKMHGGSPPRNRSPHNGEIGRARRRASPHLAVQDPRQDPDEEGRMPPTRKGGGARGAADLPRRGATEEGEGRRRAKLHFPL